MTLSKFTAVISIPALIQMRHYEALFMMSAVSRSYLADLFQ